MRHLSWSWVSLAGALLLACGSTERAPTRIAPERPVVVEQTPAPLPGATLPRFPLVVSSNKRYLQDQAGTPFPILGDSGWEASHNLTSAEQATYLDDRVARGFNAVFQQAIDAKYTVNRPPRDIAGNLPFNRRVDGDVYVGSPNGNTTESGLGNVKYAPDPYTKIEAQAPDFTTPNEAYFARLDAYVSLCASKGVLVLLWPAYVGYGGVDQGFMPEMVVNDALIGAGGLTGQSYASAARSRLWNYGAYLANRYKNASNIVWVHGGDYGDQPNNGGAFTAAEKAAVNSLFAGLKSVSGQRSTLHTAHWSRRSLATDIAFTAGSFDLEAVYADTSSAEWARRGYAHSPAAPTFILEGYYELATSGDEPNRRFQWWAMLGGVGGYFYGHGNVWPFTPGWQSSLGSQGARDMAQLNAFVRSIAWQQLVPAGLDGMKSLIVQGAGTASPQSADYVAAAATRDGSLLVAYLPPAHGGTLSVDMSALAGSIRARWLNPTTGVYTEIAKNLPNTESRSFTRPSSNGTSHNDWVLVLTGCGASCASVSPAPLSPHSTWGVALALAAIGFVRLGSRRAS